MTLGAEFDAVIRDARQGSDRAMARLYADLQPRLLRFFEARTGDAAEDLAQDTWISVAQQLGSFEGDEPMFRSWFFTIAYRRFVDHCRRSGRRPDTPTAREALEPLAPVIEHDDNVSGGEALRALLASMTEEQAEIVLLRVVAGLSVDEVAAIVGKKPGAIRVVQHRALRRAASVLSRRAVTG